ncbi:MAG: anti-sigma regulatory factor [Acidimicrobiia bacterium]|nr:anti-sigma regulatory factor [Acidimicrobiia bacterium]
MVLIVDSPDTVCTIDTEASLVTVRSRVRATAVDLGFGIVDQTKLVTAASELARNVLRYAEGGEMIIEVLENSDRRGVRVTFADNGPGIANVELALRDGYSTGDSLGIGLPGAKRLVDDLTIDSVLGRGTTVVITTWAS